MKVVILAGGRGTRLSEETDSIPKPMVCIGGRPILWHIMKFYSTFGMTDFIICCGYRGYVIKEYFANYFLHMSDVTFDLAKGKMTVHQNYGDPWHVTLVDTGEETMTGGRLKRVAGHIGSQTFCMTYGDGLANVDIRALIQTHKKAKALATVTAVQPPGRFGSLCLQEDWVMEFREKVSADGGWINGGFFVLEPKVLGYITGDQSVWEKDCMPALAEEKKLVAYKHRDFWHPMDMQRDKIYLEDLWQKAQAPWKVW